jgi:hypothetical protein
MEKTYIQVRVPNTLIKLYKKADYFVRKFSYLVNPDRCSRCGTKMYAKFYQLEHHFDNGRRLLVENVGGVSNKCICRVCLLELLESKPWEPRFSQLARERGYYMNKDGWTKTGCAVLGTKEIAYKDIEIWPLVSVVLCKNSWNTDYFSRQAILECVQKGKVRTTSLSVFKGKIVCVNHKGLYINEQGKLL